MALKKGGMLKGRSRIPGVSEFHGNEGGRDGEKGLDSVRFPEGGCKKVFSDFHPLN